MMPQPQESHEAALVSAHVSSSTPVLPGHALDEPNTRVPTFGDTVWDLSPFRSTRNRHPGHFRLDFGVYQDPARQLVVKEYLYALLNVYQPGTRRRLAVGGAIAAVWPLRRFFTYLDTAWGGMRLAQVTQPVLDAYLADCQQRVSEGALSVSGAQQLVDVPIKLYVYRAHLSTDRLLIDPWGGQCANRVVGMQRRRENSTPRIPDAVLRPLIAWALFYVETASRDILEGLAELERYRTGHMQTGPVYERIHRWLEARRAAGRGIPAYERPEASKQEGGVQEALLRDVNIPLILLMSGVGRMRRGGERGRTMARVEALLSDGVRDLGLEPGGMDTSISLHPATGRPWRERFSPQSLPVERFTLITACYIVCAYLSGMRDSELVGLKHGCHRTERSADGIAVRHKLHGTVYKHRGRGGIEVDWVVIEPVVTAVDVLEQLSPGPYLFTPRSIIAATPEHAGTFYSREGITRFIQYLNTTQGEDGRPIIPAIDGTPWSVTPSQFRRTLAWHIAAQPFGVVAGKIQYQHVSVATFEGYAGRSGFRTEVEAERTLHRLESIVDLYEDHKQGVRSIGAGAARINRLFDDVRAQLDDFPGHIVDRARVRNMLQHQARVLYPGLLNDCFFEASTALCLREQKGDAPILPQCEPGKCPNSRISERHLPAWQQAIASGKAYLANRRLPVLQQTVVRERMQQMERVIAPLIKGRAGGKGGAGGREAIDRA